MGDFLLSIVTLGFCPGQCQRRPGLPQLLGPDEQQHCEEGQHCTSCEDLPAAPPSCTPLWCSSLLLLPPLVLLPLAPRPSGAPPSCSSSFCCTPLWCSSLCCTSLWCSTSLNEILRIDKWMDADGWMDRLVDGWLDEGC